MTEPWLLEQQVQQKKEGKQLDNPMCIRCGNPVDTVRALYLDGDWYCQRCLRRCMREVEAG